MAEDQEYHDTTSDANILCNADEMGRFYRHVLIEKNYPHHGAVAFGHYGKALFEVMKYIGIDTADLDFNQPNGMLYPTENPF